MTKIERRLAGEAWARGFLASVAPFVRLAPIGKHTDFILWYSRQQADCQAR
jgi:hypothetical protein